MVSLLTPDALKELSRALKSSRRAIAEIYRYSTLGLSANEVSLLVGDTDPRRVNDHLSSLKILFGNEILPKRGQGRQKAITEAERLLSGNLVFSDELASHLETILLRAEKTNTRRADGYQPPSVPRRSVYQQAREAVAGAGDGSGIYVVSKAGLIEDGQKSGQPPLVKIGWSNNVWDRLSGLQTWEPEPIEVLRLFPCSNPNTIEAKIHICLDTLGLAYDGGGGKEWFSAPLPLIDAIASSLGLEDHKADL